MRKQMPLVTKLSPVKITYLKRTQMKLVIKQLLLTWMKLLK
jgi:hypothetical protein